MTWRSSVDFLKRLFGASDEPPVASQINIDAATYPETPSPSDAAPVESANASEGVEIKWRNIAGETGRSSYAGEVEGIRVATVVKHDGADAGREPWEWRLEVPTAGPAAGNARILRDAKPAVAQALVGWQH
jgi:hypothetical protein